LEVGIAVVTGLASFAGAWGALHVHMKWMRRDIEIAFKLIDKVEEKITKLDERLDTHEKYFC